METLEKENELLMACTALFMKYGVKSLTMDDIASHLGISKKTIYLYVSDKKDLVNKAVSLHIKNEECLITSLCCVDKENAIDELLDINQKMSEKLQSIQPAVMYDLQKFYPEAWKIIEDHKTCFVSTIVKENIEKGIKEGLYRENVNPVIISNLYVVMVNKIFDTDLFPHMGFDYRTLHLEMARYHIRGIASRKGIEYLKEKLAQTNQEF
jgi:AcrR family transcriptional regulator